jgi:hypothetical protein
MSGFRYGDTRNFQYGDFTTPPELIHDGCFGRKGGPAAMRWVDG